MVKRNWVSAIVTLLFVVVGCQPMSGAVEPTVVVDLSPSDSTPTSPAPVIISQLPTATQTYTPMPTATLVPPTTTPLPTETALPPTPPTPTATPDPDACLPLNQTAGARSPYMVNAAEWPRPYATGIEVYTGSSQLQMMHLGFDVEGSTEQLPTILDLLDRHGIKTTMFIMGAWANNYPDWVREFNIRGHEFANHTWSHSDMKDVEAWQVKEELNDTEQLVQQLTGRTTKPWFRPPYGSRTQASVTAAQQVGWTHVIWSGSAEDWKQDTTAEKMCATLKSGAYPGAILYSHTSHPELVTALDMFISEMHLQGYTFVPLSVLMSGSPQNYLISQ